MSSSKSFIVTGIGGDIGVSICKSLRDEYPDSIIIGTDINEEIPWQIYVNHFYKVPAIKEWSSYEKSFLDIINTHKVDIVIPTSEPELRKLCELKIENFGDAKTLMADFATMKIGFDKFQTISHLKTHNIQYPWTEVASEAGPRDYPCIFKAKSGCGSKDVEILNTSEDFEKVKHHFNLKDFIFQQYLPDNENEYTCGVFNDGENFQTLVLKRKLKNTMTGSGTVVSDSKIDDYLLKIAKSLEVKGSINLQLRMNEGTPYLFEINPRFSSTVHFRHLLGFKDLIWSINLLEEKKAPLFDVTPVIGKKIFKINDEVIL